MGFAFRPRYQPEELKRVSAMMPESHVKALEESAEQNERSLAAELRLAVQDWLRKQGRML